MLYLHGLGHYHPEGVITNRFLEELDIGTTEEWILERVGIRTRRTVLPLDYLKDTLNRDLRLAQEVCTEGNAKTGALAARMALERCGLDSSAIGMVISGSSAPDHLSPAEAATIAAELNIDAPCFDLNSACTSFGMQINMLLRMKPEALPPFILLVNPENLTKSVNYADRKSAVLFGDCSTAAVVSLTEPAGIHFRASFADSNPAAWQKVTLPRLNYFQQNGNAVQGFAIRQTTEGVKGLLEACGRDGRRFKFVGHQANLGMLTTVCERIGIAPEDHWYNVDRFGNTAAAGAPSVLSGRWDELKEGLAVAVSLVGAGLTWTEMLLEVT